MILNPILSISVCLFLDSKFWSYILLLRCSIFLFREIPIVLFLPFAWPVMLFDKICAIVNFRAVQIWRKKNEKKNQKIKERKSKEKKKEKEKGRKKKEKKPAKIKKKSVKKKIIPVQFLSLVCSLCESPCSFCLKSLSFVGSYHLSLVIFWGCFSCQSFLANFFELLSFWWLLVTWFLVFVLIGGWLL